jgi:hypothetical protein
LQEDISEKLGISTIAETQPQPQPAFIGDQFPILHPVSGRDSAARMIMPVGFNCGFEFEKGRQRGRAAAPTG